MKRLALKKINYIFKQIQYKKKGCIAKQYQVQEIQVDLRKLAIKCGAEFIKQRAVKVEPRYNKIILEDGTEVKYDILSINVGSRTLGTQTVPGVWEYSLTTRPVNCT